MLREGSGSHPIAQQAGNPLKPGSQALPFGANPTRAAPPLAPRACAADLLLGPFPKPCRQGQPGSPRINPGTWGCAWQHLLPAACTQLRLLPAPGLDPPAWQPGWSKCQRVRGPSPLWEVILSSKNVLTHGRKQICTSSFTISFCCRCFPPCFKPRSGNAASPLRPSWHGRVPSRCLRPLCPASATQGARAKWLQCPWAAPRQPGAGDKTQTSLSWARALPAKCSCPRLLRAGDARTVRLLHPHGCVKVRPQWVLVVVKAALWGILQTGKRGQRSGSDPRSMYDNSQVSRRSHSQAVLGAGGRVSLLPSLQSSPPPRPKPWDRGKGTPGTRRARRLLPQGPEHPCGCWEPGALQLALPRAARGKGLSAQQHLLLLSFLFLFNTTPQVTAEGMLYTRKPLCPELRRRPK